MPSHTTRYTPHPTPHTLHPTPYTLQPSPYTPHPTPYTPHPTPLFQEAKDKENIGIVMAWVEADKMYPNLKPYALRPKP